MNILRASQPEDPSSTTAEFHRILQNKQLTIQFQPIIQFQSGQTHGYEALSRGPMDSYFYRPDRLFPFAEKIGQLYRLEKIARELAIQESNQILQNEKLFINLNAEVIYDVDFNPGHTISLLKEHDLTPQNVVFEITERSAINDYAAFKRALNHYREQGFQIAIDDAGAGYSSLQAISEIMPDYIKVDRSLISGIDQNQVKEGILEAFVTFAKKTNSTIIAEGIETETELQKVMELGIDFGQGFYFAKPMNPITEINEQALHFLKDHHLHSAPAGKTIYVDPLDTIVFYKNGAELKRMHANELMEKYW